jgi:nitronate monooxygenase
MRNAFTERFSLSVPVIQAPMAGGGDTPQLVAAVSNAGGLGTFGAGYMTPEQIEERGREIRSLTDKPFGVNLFAPMKAPQITDWRDALEKLLPYYAEVAATPPAEIKPVPHDFNAQLDAALNCGARVFSFTFGDLAEEVIAKIKSRGLYVMGTATTVEEAMTLQESGVDAIVAQGAEAGGHRGTFLEDFETSMVGTIALVPQIVDAAAVPVIASGGIMDGRGVAAALVLGASAAQLGTAFLTCKEAGASEAYKDAIFSAREQDTRITRGFSGRPARGIVNRFMREIGDEVPPFPIQNQLTRPLRNAAAKLGRAEFLNLWSGQGTRMARRQSAAELVALIDVELDAAFNAAKQQRIA